MEPPTHASFEEPPLKEVSISIQFEAINSLHLGLIGSLWESYRKRYPKVEQGNELSHEIEKFGVVQRRPPKFQFLDNAPTPRVLFISESDEYLIQVQRDRFIFNWRVPPKATGADYPRYPVLRDKLIQEWEAFTNFLSQNEVPPPSYNQVELTYINHIEAEDRETKEIFRGIVDEPNSSENLISDSFSVKLTHIVQQDKQSVGRLYTTIEKANRLSDGAPIHVLNFLARAHPSKNTTEAVLEMIDFLRSEINQRFVAVTHKSMHLQWKSEH